MVEDVQLSAEQQLPFSAIESGDNVLITGSAGTGKSTILRALVNRFGRKLPIVASTGIAAVNVGGITLHSWASLGLGKAGAKTIANSIISQRGKAFNNIVDNNRLALDEVSMISSSLFAKLDHIFRLVRATTDPEFEKLPFGGMQMILFGDFLQLPPVIRDNPKDGFAFESSSWEFAKIKVFFLIKVWRQEDIEFSTALNHIRVGEYPPLVSKVLRSRYKQVDPNPEIEPVVVHTHNADVDRINHQRLAKIEGEPKIYTAHDEGRPSVVKMLDKHCLAPTELHLKVGAQVMLLYNMEPENGLANGSIGVVSKIESYPEVKFANGLTRILERHEWEIKEDGYPIATRRQIPLRLAWAITAHKSQGQTLDKIKVFLGECFEYGQAYVAMSRVRTMEGLFIESGTKASIMAHPKAIEFYKNAVQTEML
jgi:ATP-dependent DNA helicase PIF1